MSADASERENETRWIWPVFLEKWLPHAKWGSALCAGITFALACIDRSAVMRERSQTRARNR
jgi:hypothetical protein